MRAPPLVTAIINQSKQSIFEEMGQQILREGLTSKTGISFDDYTCLASYMMWTIGGGGRTVRKSLILDEEFALAANLHCQKTAFLA